MYCNRMETHTWLNRHYKFAVLQLREKHVKSHLTRRRV